MKTQKIYLSTQKIKVMGKFVFINKYIKIITRVLEKHRQLNIMFPVTVI